MFIVVYIVYCLIVGYLNNIWQFDLSNGTWRHLFGNISTDAEPVYDIGSAYPGGMADHAMVYAMHGVFYVYGGYNGSRILIKLY